MHSTFIVYFEPDENVLATAPAVDWPFRSAQFRKSLDSGQHVGNLYLSSFGLGPPVMTSLVNRMLRPATVWHARWCHTWLIGSPLYRNVISGTRMALSLPPTTEANHEWELARGRRWTAAVNIFSEGHPSQPKEPANSLGRDRSDKHRLLAFYSPGGKATLLIGRNRERHITCFIL